MERNIKQGVVSIIIPVYNMDDLLERSLESIISQTYENIEVIIVDDGSSDRSGEIADSYTQRFDNVLVIHHGTNKGIACGFITGIENATGEYILFVDSDNYIAENMVQELVSICEEMNADIVQCDAVCYTDEKELMELSDTNKITVLNEKREMLSDFFEMKTITNNLAAKLFKRKLFEGVTIPEGRQIVDVIILPQLIERCSKYVCVASSYYYAYQAPNSVSRGNVTERRISDLLYADEFYEAFITEHWPQYVDFAKYRKAKSAIWAYNNIYASDLIEEKLDYMKQFREQFKEQYLDAKRTIYFRKMPLLQKVRYWLFYWFPIIYKVILKCR